MSNLLSNTSFGVIRTNPKLTTNVKLLYNGENLFLESFNANTQLANSTYKNFKISGKSTYDHDLYRFYNVNASTPTEIAYDVFEEYAETDVLSSFGHQYEMMYNMGVRAIASEAYDEDMGLLFPLWLNKHNIPNYFVIFRLDGPVSIDYDNIETDKNNRLTFSDKILKNAKIIKTFDLTENSLLGSYLRRYVNQSDFPDAPLFVTWNENEPWEWKGISFKKGGFSKGSNYVYEDLIVKDASLIENEYYITKGFERHGIVCANLINLEFLFSDEEAKEYTMNRYFGFYVNTLEEAQFDINGANMYHCRDINQSPRFNTEASKINKNLTDSIIVENPNGVLISIDNSDSTTLRKDNSFLSSEEVNLRNSLFYVQDRLGNFHSIKKSDKKEWNDNEIRLADTSVDISLFTGFQEPTAYANCKLIDRQGKALACIEIESEITEHISIQFDDFSYRGYSFTEDAHFAEHGNNPSSLIFSEKINDDETYVYNKVYGRLAGEDYIVYPGTSNEQIIHTFADTNEGRNYHQYFCVTGKPENVAKAIEKSINEGIDEDHRFFVAKALGNKVYIQAKFVGEAMNSLRIKINTVNGGAANGIKLYYVENDTDTIAEFIGGTTEPKSILRIDKNDNLRFSRGKYLKTVDGYAKIIGHLPYIEEPVYDDDDNLLYFNDVDKYETVFCDEGYLDVPTNNVVPLYEDFKNSLGRFAFFPVKDFDFDIYSDYYKSCYDLLEEQEYYTTSYENPSFNNEIDKNPDIIKFYENGFAVLKNLDSENFDGNEYDRLNEKYIKELADVSKVVPYINKWGYFNQGKNVRDKFYRLNANLAFGQHNFAPNICYDKRDPDAFSHEWYYILGIPSYYTDENNDIESYEHLHNYIKPFSDDIIEDLCNVDENMFLKYFIFDNVNNITKDEVVVFTPNIKYSEFDGGDYKNFSQTFFRGVKVIIKELAKEIDYNNEIVNPTNLAYKYNGKYNNYKFSCVLRKTDHDDISIIKNEKWKTVTIVCSVQIDEYKNPWCLNFDRTALYALNSEYDKTTLTEDEVKAVDKNIGDILVYASSENNGYAVVRGSEIGSSVSISNKGTYNDIKFVHDGRSYVIEFTEDGEIEIDDNAATAFLYNFKIKDVTDSNSVYYINREFEYINSELLLHEGYRDYYKHRFSNIGFKNIFEKINGADKKDINYIVIDEDGRKRRKTDFLIELVSADNIIKSKYLTSIVDPNRPSKFNVTNAIGCSLSINNISIIPITRHKGNYEPIFRDCLFFADIFIKEEYNEDENIINLCRYNNSEFNTRNVDFGLIKNMFYHKVNEENAGGILEFSKDSAFDSLYPLIDEIGTSKRDFYIFNSNWDPDYFVKNLNKTQFELQPGTKSMLEKKSFFGSKYFKIPQSLIIDTFVACDEFDLRYIERNNYEYIDGHYMHNEKSNSIEFYVFLQKRLTEYFTECMHEYFKQHIKPEYSYNNIENVDDDIKFYIENNILPLYTCSKIDFFTKHTRERIPYVYETSKLNNLDKIRNLLKVNTVVTVDKLNNNPFDFKLTYNIERGCSDYFGLSVNIIKK